MAYHCPKCHCGCMFEDKGKLVCLNCGHRCSKLSAQGVEHAHPHITYTGEPRGGRETPRAVPPRKRTDAPPERPASRSSAQPRPYAGAAGADRPAGQRRRGCLVGLIVFAILIAVPLIPYLLEYNDSDSLSSTSFSHPEESGICYVMQEGVPEEAYERMREAVLEYNLDHDEKDAQEVEAYLADYFAAEPLGCTYTVEQDGADVCVTLAEP